MTQRLSDPPYLAFPLRIDSGGPRTAGRAEHIRGQIEQVLFTLPGERVFRPDFGAGVRALVFEPNSAATRQVTRQRLLASLAEALQGEVDPKSIEVEVEGEDSRLEITVSYVLAAIGQQEKHRFTLGGTD
jgi:hypothetical protein